MNTVDITSTPVWELILKLTEDINNDEFESNIYQLLLEVADISHFTVKVVDVSRLKEEKLTLIGGKESNYRAKMNMRRAEEYTKKIDVHWDHNLEQFAQGMIKQGGVFRYRPDPDQQTEIADIYEENKICEKAYEMRIRHGRIYQLNLFRSIDSGPFTDEELKKLEGLLPFIFNIVLLHFQICGADEWQKHNEKHVVSFLKNNGVDYFAPLTKQETEVCDLIVYGQTTEGISAEMDISVSSVKTYRNRAYKKLNISSKSELFALIINSQIY